MRAHEPFSLYHCVQRGEKIADTINSVLWADEIIVADSSSTDETPRIAQELGARVVQIPFQGFGHLRNEAIKSCTHEWILSLDTDERCTPEVRDEILGLLAGVPAHDAYLVPRRNYFMGRWIKHSGWYLISPAATVSKRGHEVCGISCP